MNDSAPTPMTPRIVKVLLAVLVLYMCFGSAFYHIVEGWRWLDSFYFVAVTLATIGYGDFAPKTDAGKLFTIPYIFIGVGAFVYVANAFLRHRAEVRLSKRQSKQDKKG